MPLLVLTTNLPDDAISNAFIQRFAKLLSETTGKPEKIVEVIVKSNTRIFMAGSFDAAVSMSLSTTSLLGMSDEDKDRYCDVLCSFTMKELNLPAERVLLVFEMFDASNVGHKWGTVKSAPTRHLQTS